MKYEIFRSKDFKKSFKKLSETHKSQVLSILERLANDEILEPKYKDHKLKGEYEGFRECHIKPDLLLIYEKCEDILILTAINVGSHSELF
ncbi:type II toxin-antitoxin system YafQ family toxin [Helicobacter sp. 11S02596-1]|uniref:type II toxin-antitoxin system YafQ family toxin n=1 Tax=Helicobacter sp. 11S02596-1 TaxID=1476194 RepID=UPI000BA560D1|nr:type II toxin-antitoxin system YafQ family toxin [Helicobacter sp. 11S02596-1]PAF43617.1 addiction module toxin RelE [Helicobacter sp. 11S02596-1]